MLEEQQVAQFLQPYIAMLIGLVASLWVKDIVTSFVKGMMFRLSPFCQEGDLVIIDGEFAIVVKIGIRSTIFSIEKEDGVRTWRSVQNERIAYLKLEKIVPTAVKSKAISLKSLNNGDDNKDD